MRTRRSPINAYGASKRAIEDMIRVPLREGHRREAHACRLVCGSGRATVELGWMPLRSEMETILADAWRVASPPA